MSGRQFVVTCWSLATVVNRAEGRENSPDKVYAFPFFHVLCFIVRITNRS